MDLKQIEDALARYVEQESPGYAVMLDGSWGSGKTYFVENDVRQISKAAKLKFCLVSLYGIRSEEQLADAILEGFLSIKGLSKDNLAEGVNLMGKLAKTLSDVSGDTASLGTSLMSAIAGATKNRISNSIGKNVLVVFDDLERSAAIPNDVLGWINNRVEHQGFRSLIVCNEQSLRKKRKITSKEKVVGFTYKFEPSNEYIIDASINALKVRSGKSGNDKFRKILGSVLPKLTAQIKLTNIRTLTHALVTIKEVLDDYPGIVKDEERIQELVGAALFYSISYRDLLVPDSDLEKLARSPNDMSVQYHLGRHRDENKKNEHVVPKWFRAYEQIGSHLLGEVGYLSIWQLVRHGYLDKERFNTEKSSWRNDNAPALMKILHTPWTLPDEELAQAFKSVKEGIEANTLIFESFGEALRLLIKLRYLYKEEAINIQETELDALSIKAIENLNGHSEVNPEIGHLFADDISGDAFLERYLDLLKAESKKRKSQNDKAELLRLLELLLEGNSHVRDGIDAFDSKPGLDRKAAEVLLAKIPEATPTQLWDFGYALHSRYGRVSLAGSDLAEDLDGVKCLDKGVATLLTALPRSGKRAALRRINSTLAKSLSSKKS
tara:strand:- start:1209 stop:3032 length:1824 start_codon:yes stop_codon:yes gene_type:complete